MYYAEHYRDIATGLPGQHLPWLQTLRQRAELKFSLSGFPSPREEEWRYTNITPIEKKRFQPGRVTDSASPVVGDLMARHRLQDSWTLVFVDGLFSTEHSALDNLPACVEVLSLASALNSDPELVEPLLQQADATEEHGFIDFTTAYFRDGACIRIAEGVALEKPVQILHLSTQPEGLAVMRHVIALGKNAEASVIETYVGTPEAASLTAAVTGIVLGENAGLDHTKLQAESSRSYHFGGIYVNQQTAARLRQQHAAFGGLIARTEIHSRLGKGADCELNGLFLASGRRHLDTHTQIRHAEPYGSSREQYRGIAAERGRGVFSGRIVVEKDAQRTDAEMSSRNLLLSEDAEIDSKPQLEIHADDVKCAHGVTIGQLDAEAVFYLESRGIDRTAARNMLTFGFANEMVEKIRHDGLRQQVRDLLLANLPAADIRGDWL